MTDPNPDGKKTGRAAGGRFAVGNKESPGRPPGRGAVAEMREALSTDLHKIIDTIKTQALAGDLQAIRIILERVLPALRPIELPTPLTLPDGSLTEQGKAVLAAVAAGDIAPGQGAALLASLGTLAKLTEADLLERRIEALEQRFSNSQGLRK
jgi:hypothetical protein